MRELGSDEFGIMLSFFAVLLLAFAANFRFSRKAVRRHRTAALWFVILSFVGEICTVIALVLTWVALWSPHAWEVISDLLVLVPGSMALVCAVLLTFESVYARAMHIVKQEREDRLADEAKRSEHAQALAARSGQLS